MFATCRGQVRDLSATCRGLVADLSAIRREQVRDLLNLVECGKLRDPLTMRSIPECFCDGVGWLAHKEALYKVSSIYIYLYPYLYLTWSYASCRDSGMYLSPQGSAATYLRCGGKY